MTASTRPRPDFATLDEHIADALVSLRLARTASARSPNSESIRAQADAEAYLNALLEGRRAAQSR